MRKLLVIQGLLLLAGLMLLVNGASGVAWFVFFALIMLDSTLAKLGNPGWRKA